MTTQIPIFDGHNDALLRYLREDGYDFLRRTDAGHLDIERAGEGGFAGGFFAIFVPTPREEIPDFSQFKTETGINVPLPDQISQPYALEKTLFMSAQLFRIERESGGRFKVVRTVADLTDCIENGVMAAVLHLEGAEAIDEDMHALEVYYQAGLRSIGPVWSRANIFAEGVPFRFPSSPDTGPGLTDAGRRLVR